MWYQMCSTVLTAGRRARSPRGQRHRKPLRGKAPTPQRKRSASAPNHRSPKAATPTQRLALRPDASSFAGWTGIGQERASQICNPRLTQSKSRFYPSFVIPRHLFANLVVLSFLDDEDRPINGCPIYSPDIIQAWLHLWSEDRLWPLFEKALNDERLLLMVDGLDEYRSEDSARNALAQLQVFAEQRNCRVIATARPAGYDRLGVQRTGWSATYLAELTLAQQEQYALRWFAHQRELLGETGEQRDRIAQSSWLPRVSWRKCGRPLI